MGNIYAITNLVNGRYYVGQTTQEASRRFREHTESCKRLDTPLARAIGKHGPENFSIEVLATAESREQLNDLESLWIIATGSNMSGLGYNCNTGGDVRTLNEETKRKISKTLTGVPKNYPSPNKGKPMSDRQKAMLSVIFKGRPGYGKGVPLSVETRAKLSVSLKGHRGRVWSEDDRMRHSVAIKGRPSAMKGRHLDKPRKSSPMSIEQRTKISAALRGRMPTVNLSGRMPWNKGIKGYRLHRATNS